jgi:hypothetical protein
MGWRVTEILGIAWRDSMCLNMAILIQPKSNEYCCLRS